jgi:hypothetical protein
VHSQIRTKRRLAWRFCNWLRSKRKRLLNWFLALKSVRGENPIASGGKLILQLTEEVLIRRFHDLSREEIRRMFKLHDIRKTRVWLEAQEEGIEIGTDRTNQKHIKRLKTEGKSLKEIADLLAIPLSEVRRLASR